MVSDKEQITYKRMEQITHKCICPSLLLYILYLDTSGWTHYSMLF